MKRTTGLERILTIIMVMGLLVATSPLAANAATQVFVSIVPQQYFVEKIGGPLVDVDVLVMPGANPHMYEPTPRQMTKLSKAKAYFAIGVGLEETWLPRINAANQSMRIFHTQRGIEKIPMVAHGHQEEHEDEREAGHEDGHGHDGAEAEHGHHHDHGTLDPHIWLSPKLALTIARNTCAGLIRIDPENRKTYESNLAKFLIEIQKTDAAITKTLAAVPADKRTFMVFHPSWGYFANQYGLTQIPIEAEGNEPSPKHLAEIIEHGRELHIPVIFVQPQFSQKSAQVIAAELDARVIPLDPLAKDWKDNLLQAAEAFSKTLK